LIVLKNLLEYEATQSYLLRITVKDTGNDLQGNLTIEVSKDSVFILYKI